MAVFTSRYVLLNGVTTTTTSTGVVLGDRLNVGLQYLVSINTSGSVNFTVDVSNDNNTWVQYARLLSNSTAGAAYVTLTASGKGRHNYFAFKPAGDNFSYLRVNANYNNAVGASITVIAVGTSG